MARPIRNTPILYGEDARRFISEAEQTIAPSVRRENRLRMEESLRHLEMLFKKHNIRANA